MLIVRRGALRSSCWATTHPATASRAVIANATTQVLTTEDDMARTNGRESAMSRSVPVHSFGVVVNASATQEPSRRRSHRVLPLTATLSV